MYYHCSKIWTYNRTSNERKCTLSIVRTLRHSKFFVTSQWAYTMRKRDLKFNLGAESH